MEQLRLLAEGELDNGMGAPGIEVPSAVIKAVLALPPLERAALGVMIAGSLADELVHARAIATVQPRKPASRKRHAARVVDEITFVNG